MHTGCWLENLREGFWALAAVLIRPALLWDSALRNTPEECMSDWTPRSKPEITDSREVIGF